MGDVALRIVAVTRHGVPLAQRLGETFGHAGKSFVPAHDTPATSVNDAVERYELPASQQVGLLLRQWTPLLIIAPVGEVVSLLAPHLSDEASHPPVIAVDTEGQFAVPLLRGARGEGDTLAEQI